MLAWLIEHAGGMYTLHAHDESMKDGLTPFRRLKGRDWSVALPPWGETVDYRVRTKHKLEARWATGIFCGVRVNTTEKVIATEAGIVVAQSVRRRPKEHRWDAALFAKVQGTPWAPIPGRAVRPEEAAELPEAVDVQPELPEVPAGDAEAAEKKESLKRVYIRQMDLDAYGYTASCPACHLIRIGENRQGVAHSEACRAHIVERLEKTEEGKKRLAAAKRQEPSRKAPRVSEESPPPAAAASKREPAEPAEEVERPAKRSHEVGQKKARVEVEVEAPSAEPSSSSRGPAPVAAAVSPSPTSPSRKRALDEDDMVVNLLLSLREGVLAAAQGQPYPVCEEHFETQHHEEFETSYWDDISGKPLRPELVQEARREEIATIKEMGVWEVIPRPHGEPTISTRWVDVNKRDEQKPKYRSRLVARELKKRTQGPSSEAYTPSWEDFYASMPPISALRTLFALAVTDRVPDSEGQMRAFPRGQCLVFLDIKKAHFWADARRRLLVELPEELRCRHSEVRWVASQIALRHSRRTCQLGGDHLQGHEPHRIPSRSL